MYRKVLTIDQHLTNALEKLHYNRCGRFREIIEQRKTRGRVTHKYSLLIKT